MDADVILASAHHLLAFLLIATLAVELTLIRPGMSPRDVRTATRVDAAYGAIFGLLLVAGIARVVHAGAARYLVDTIFWMKMAAILAAAAASLPPTLAILGWRRQCAADATFVPLPEDIQRLRRLMHVQAAVLLAVPVLAALLARGYGL